MPRNSVRSLLCLMDRRPSKVRGREIQISAPWWSGPLGKKFLGIPRGNSSSVYAFRATWTDSSSETAPNYFTIYLVFPYQDECVMDFYHRFVVVDPEVEWLRKPISPYSELYCYGRLRGLRSSRSRRGPWGIRLKVDERKRLRDKSIEKGARPLDPLQWWRSWNLSICPTKPTAQELLL